jgi:hypothetical protein
MGENLSLQIKHMLNLSSDGVSLEAKINLTFALLNTLLTIRKRRLSCGTHLVCVEVKKHTPRDGGARIIFPPVAVIAMGQHRAGEIYTL